MTANNEFTWRFDAIVMCIEAPGRCFDDKDNLCIIVDFFKKCRPAITGRGRINVTNFFCPGPLCEFKADRDCLRESLILNGVNFMVTYCGETIGCGHVNITKKNEQKLCSMYPPSEIVQTADIELNKGECTTGLIKVKFRLQQVCMSDDDGDDEDECDNYARCDNVDNNVNDDILFMLNDEFNDCDETENEPTLVSSKTNSFCCQKDASPNKLRDMIDELCGKEQITCRRPKKCLKCTSSTSNKSSSKDPAYNYEIQMPPHKIPRSIGDEMVQKIFPKISAPILKQTHYKTPRLCPICQEDVSWLPKLATCPYCNYKPVPVVEEKPYNEAATAENILGTQLQRAPDNATSDLSDYACRLPQAEMRGASDDEFESIIKNFKYLKHHIKKNREGFDGCARVPKSKQNQDSKPANNEARPHLAQVFTELKTLFEAKQTKSKSATINEICQDACKVTKSLTKAHKRQVASEKSIAELCEPPKLPHKKKLKRKFQQIKSRVYSTITMKHSSHARLGHKTCINGYSGGRKNVPGHMGWLWTSSSMASRPGWKPGAIRRSIRELMGYFLNDFPVDGIPVSKYMSYYTGKRPKPPPRKNEEKAEDLVQHPTLHVLKKNDEYIITLRPLKHPDDITKCANPYLDMKPVQFRIVKNPFLKQLRDMKRCLKEMGFSKCTCHRPVMECYCRSFIDKKRLIHELNKECQKRDMESCKEKLVLSDTTDSEAEYDFSVTPPAGLIKPELLKKIDLTNSETQYKDEDWLMQTRFPQPPNALIQYQSCAMGERKNRFNYIYGKGKINRDDDNKPKKKKKKTQPKKGKRLKGGGSGFISSYSDDSVEEPIGHVTFEARRMDAQTKPVPKAIAHPYAFIQPQLAKGIGNINMRPRPLSEARIKRLTMASIPPAARGIDVNGQRIIKSSSVYTPSSIIYTNVEYPSPETTNKTNPYMVQQTIRRTNEGRDVSVSQSIQLTTNNTPATRGTTVPHAAQPTKNSKTSSPRVGGHGTKVVSPRRSQQQRHQTKKGSTAVSVKSSKTTLRRSHASTKTHRLDKSPAAENTAKGTTTRFGRPTVSRSRTKTETQAKRAAIKPVAKSAVGGPTKSGKLVETKRSIR